MRRTVQTRSPKQSDDANRAARNAAIRARNIVLRQKAADVIRESQALRKQLAEDRAKSGQ